MPRPKQVTNIQIPPRIKGFMPIGNYSGMNDQIFLHYEEFESIRLLDYEGLSQEEAAVIMEVSRPTLTRIYTRARNKIATALTEALILKIEGGSAIYSSEWFYCSNCNARFNNINKEFIEHCIICKEKSIEKITLIK